MHLFLFWSESNLIKMVEQSITLDTSTTNPIISQKSDLSSGLEKNSFENDVSLVERREFRTKPQLQTIEAQICLTAECRHFASKNTNSPRTRNTRTRFLKANTRHQTKKGAFRHPSLFGGA